MAPLVKYAGKSGQGWRKPTPKNAVRNRLAARADNLFHIGRKDTLEIAREMNITEAKADRLVTIGRCLRLGLPIPFGEGAGE